MDECTTRYFNLTFVFDAENRREAFVRDIQRSKQFDVFEYTAINSHILMIETVIALYDAFDQIVADHAQFIQNTSFQGRFEEDVLYYRIDKGILYWADPVPGDYRSFRKEEAHAI